MGIGQGAYLAQAQQETTTTIIVVAVVAAAIASLLGVLMARRLAGPLQQLEATAAAVAQGDLAARSGLSGRGDEIGSLGRSFDAMAADLERNDASRRRFFQDAAHEMKTPLAVIEATAAAVMDGVYPHDDRHLETIRSQARLLGRVVDDLRTISLAEAGALPLRLEPVLLGEVLPSIGSAFAARADAAGVTLSTELARRRAAGGHCGSGAPGPGHRGPRRQRDPVRTGGWARARPGRPVAPIREPRPGRGPG